MIRTYQENRTRDLLKIALSLLLAVLVSAVAMWPSWAAGSDDNQQKLDQVNQQIEQEKAQLAQKEKQKQLVTQQLQQVDQSIVQTQDDLNNLNGNLTLLQTRITNDQQDLQKTQASLDDRTSIFDQRLKDIYIDGNVSYLDVLLNATTLNDFLTRFDMLQRIAEQDISLMKQITAMRDQIAQNKKDMEDQAGANGRAPEPGPGQAGHPDCEQSAKETTGVPGPGPNGHLAAKRG